MVPPGLVWLEAFRESTSEALDQRLRFQVYPTVNALVYRVRIDWMEPIKPETAMRVWNLFQKWAGANESTPSGRVEWRNLPHPMSGENLSFGFQVDIHLRERLGHPKNTHPAA